MSDDIHKIIADFKATIWKTKPYERVVALLEKDPAAAPGMVRSMITDLKMNPTFLHYTIDCLPEAAFPELAQVALDSLIEVGKNEAAEDFIAHTSLQSLESLH